MGALGAVASAVSYSHRLPEDIQLRALSQLMFDDVQLNGAILHDIFEKRSDKLNVSLEQLCRLGKSARCKTFPTLLKDSDYGRLARKSFEQKVSAELLDEYFEELVPPLVADPELQNWSFQVLDGKISARRLPKVISLILDLVRGADKQTKIQRPALYFLKQQLPESLSEEQAQEIVTLLAHSNADVKEWTLRLLRKQVPGELHLQHWDKILPLFSDETSFAQVAALDTVLAAAAQLSSERLSQHSERFVALLLHALHGFPGTTDDGQWIMRKSQALTLLCELPAASLTRHREQMASCRSREGNSWLHLASAEGHLAACEALVDIAGLPLSVRNEAGKKPLELAKTDKVDRFLTQRIRSQQGRFGRGNAFDEMEQDERPVSEIVWRLVTLPEGGFHSFLVVTVSEKGAAKRYVLEKAESIPVIESIAGDAHQKHGILIGCEPLGNKSPHVMDSDVLSKHLSLSSGSLKAGLKMKDLFQQVHFSESASSICHCVAQKVFNYCCLRPEDSQTCPPSQLLVDLPDCDQLDDLLVHWPLSSDKAFAESIAEAVWNLGFRRKDLALKLLSMLPAGCSTPSGERIARYDENGNTWLHVAAQEGHLEACEALVDVARLPLRVQNDVGESPLTVSASRQVDQFLRNRMDCEGARFGHGNAFDEMEQDERQVVEVEWHTLPLPGQAGYLGGRHSFLVVAVCEQSRVVKKYVLEKAWSAAKEAHQKNGVFIGSPNLGTNLVRVAGDERYCNILSLSGGNLRTGLKMKDLYEQARNSGPYDLAESNCHHAVQIVFNYCCAREEDRQARTPNEVEAFVAGNLPFDVLNSGSIGSEASGSGVSSAKSEVASPTPDSGHAPRGFTKPFDVSSDQFAPVAAILSHAVYEENPECMLNPKEVVAGAMIDNWLKQPVHLRYSDSGNTISQVEPGRKCTVEHEGNKIVMDVDCTSSPWFSKRLAGKQPIWMGCDYVITTDFRTEVIVKEVAMPNVDVLVSAPDASPVHWLLARSGKAIYLCFRGTANVQDALIDLAAVPDYFRFAEHGSGVHGGIAHALEQRGKNVVKDVLKALQQHRKDGEQLVLCGHSLGGGYAQVMAVHLLSRNEEVSAVCTFGSPHVFIPPERKEEQRGRKVWNELCSVSQHWVLDWDPIPRLPLCQSWLDVLPQVKIDVVEGIRIGLAEIQAKVPVLEGFDVAGEVVMVNKATISAYLAPKGAPPQKKLLSEKPPESSMTLNKLNACHDMKEYSLIARMLTTPEARPAK
ncbi:unnamed protein product [Symbiodinium sp. CCMP2592]|nr:unnamed protein product [Symbiodinium sp. CCMP2592]